MLMFDLRCPFLVGWTWCVSGRESDTRVVIGGTDPTLLVWKDLSICDRQRRVEGGRVSWKTGSVRIYELVGRREGVRRSGRECGHGSGTDEVR